MQMKPLLLIPAFASVQLLAAPAVDAAPLAQWLFNDEVGTTLNQTVNTGTVAGAWSAAIGNSATTGTGDFRVSRAAGETSVALFELEAADEAITGGLAYIHVSLSGFNFEAAADETLRFEFVSAGTTTIAAGMTVGRTIVGDERIVRLEGRALGSGTVIAPTTLLTGSSSDTPLDLVLELNKDANTYSIWYRFDEASYQLAGTGNVDPARVGNRIRLEALNNFSSTGEFVDIDQITVTRTNPIPEPAGTALLGLAGLLMMARRGGQ